MLIITGWGEAAILQHEVPKAKKGVSEPIKLAFRKIVLK